MLGGFTLFFPKINVFQIVLHLIGGVATCWYIVNGWQWQTIWIIFGFCNALTAGIELCMLFAIFVIKIVVY